MAPSSGPLDDLRFLLRIRPVQLGTLTGFLAVIGGISFYLKYCVLDFDIWWHLKVGDWILGHFAVPHTGILSRSAANRPWVAYSWGYEVLLSGAYQWFGLLGIGIFGTLLTLAIAYTIYWMLHRLSGRFWVALPLTAVVCSAFLFNGMPRPFFFSIVMFCVVLTLLLEANRSGRIEPLYWLPLIFLLWVNLHIQFIYGLFIVGLVVGVNLAQRIATTLNAAPDFLLTSTLPLGKLIAIFVSCVLATLLGPNFYHPYLAVFEYSKAKFSYAIIIELQPLTFRGFSHYAELMLTAFGFFAVGWRRKIDLFKLAMLTVCSVVAYRTMRDAWFICIPAAACIADFPAKEEEADKPETLFENAGVAVAVVIFLFLVAQRTDFTERGLDRVVSANYPVDAVNFLRRNPVPGPLYNGLNWGGFLMWYMPDYPVAIDGRNDLYGDDLDKIFYKTENADDTYPSDPYLEESGVVLLESVSPLAKVLTTDPRFQLIYQDSLAVVFARR